MKPPEDPPAIAWHDVIKRLKSGNATNADLEDIYEFRESCRRGNVEKILRMQDLFGLLLVEHPCEWSGEIDRTYCWSAVVIAAFNDHPRCTLTNERSLENVVVAAYSKQIQSSLPWFPALISFYMIPMP